jgi:aminopeptidase N
MPGMMRVRSGMSAERTAAAAYPDVVVEPETRRLAAELLSREDLDPILSRVVQDADDDLRRALAARF